MHNSPRWEASQSYNEYVRSISDSSLSQSNFGGKYTKINHSCITSERQVLSRKDLKHTQNIRELSRIKCLS